MSGAKRRRVVAALNALTDERAASSVESNVDAMRGSEGCGREEALNDGISNSFVKRNFPDKVKPWDRAAYDERLSTFMPSTWFNKPRCLMSDVCSQHGWINNSSDQLKCMACNARLCVVLPPVWDRDEHQRTTNEYKEKLASGHYDFCVWKGSKSPDWFLGLPKRTYAEWLCDFQTRFDSLVQLRDNTPFIHDNALHHLDGLDGEMIGSLLTLVKHSESDFDLTACVLAMCGWEASASTCGASQHIIITCSTCKRRILHSSLLVVSDLQHTTVKHQSSPTKRQTNSIDTIVMKTPSEEKTSSYESNRLVEGDNADGACREREEHDTTGSSNVCSVPTETDVTQRDSEDGNAGVRRVEGRETSMAANSEEGDDITATEREQVCSKNGAMESTPTRDDQHTPQSLISNLFKVERLPFDVISEHSSWCPWISPPYVSTIAKTKVLTACQPGWQALVDLLSPSSCSTHQRAKTSAGETVTTVRKLLKTFT